MKCPRCCGPVALRGLVAEPMPHVPDGATWSPCPHPCHQAAKRVVEAAIQWSDDRNMGSDGYSVVAEVRALRAALEDSP